MNYSIYDNSSNPINIGNPFNPQPVTDMTTTGYNQSQSSSGTSSGNANTNQQSNNPSSSSSSPELTPDYIASKEEKISLNSVLNVSTSISNINTITGSILANSSVSAPSQSTSSSQSGGGGGGGSTGSNIAAQQAISALGLAGPAGYTKSYFDLRLKLVSSVHTQDVYLERFIAVANAHCLELSRAAATGCYASGGEGVLRQAINDLCYVEPETFVRFIYIILDKLLYLMITVSY